MKKYSLLFYVFVFLFILKEKVIGNEISISTSSFNQTCSYVTSNKENYLVVWQDEVNSSITGLDIWGRIILENSTKNDSFPVCNSSQNQFFPRSAYDGSNYLVIWINEGTGVYGQFLDKNGAFIDTNFLIVNGHISQASLWSNGNNYLIIWVNDSISSDMNICGSIISKTGVTMVPSFFISNAPDTQLFPEATSIDSNYLVVWSDRRNGDWDIFAQKISYNGMLTGNNFSVSQKSVPEQRAKIASNDTTVMIVWEEDYGLFVGWDIRASILDADMNYLYKDVVISDAAWDQRVPSVCWSAKDEKFIVSWNDYRVPIINKANIYIAKVNQIGTSSETQITNNNNFEKRETSIASSTNCFLIAWEDWRQGSSNKDIYGYIPQFMFTEENISPKRNCIEIIPNPFLESVLLKGMGERMKIFDKSGKVVKIINNDKVWYGEDNNGKKLPSGTYFIQSSDKPLVFSKIIKLSH
ncbi:MAG: hypothetical protein PHX21_08950 [bacterium]|nr:hypothetical protein [bacterium]